ncbi:MAG TPA: LD-carboxypeptidase [Planctomycetota bacterium]|nr:LD-carboxypeptidase [Planctomycetota bacterium]
MSRAVYLCVPAYPLRDADEVARTLAAAEGFAARLGLPLVASPLLERTRPAGAWLGADERRDDLARGLAHPVLLAARGGYGCLELIASMAAGADRPGPLLIGFSDLTVLHAWWRRHGRGESVYGFMPGAPHGERALASAVDCALGRGAAHAGDAAQVVAGGEARGVLFAACLRVLAGLVGTAAMPDLAGTVLALEDIDERPYRVDRDLMQLHLSGALAGVRALVFARFPCALPPDYAGPSMRSIAASWARRLGVPAIIDLPFGHDPDPLALPCGRPATLRCAPDGWRLDIASRVGLA